jgi:hypothetical protein
MAPTLARPPIHADRWVFEEKHLRLRTDRLME